MLPCFVFALTTVIQPSARFAAAAAAAAALIIVFMCGVALCLFSGRRFVKSIQVSETECSLTSILIRVGQAAKRKWPVTLRKSGVLERTRQTERSLTSIRMRIGQPKAKRKWPVTLKKSGVLLLERSALCRRWAYTEE
jgi:hypothetical protein